MVASEMTEYCYSEEQMRALLGGSDGPLAASTMRQRIYRKSKIPPFIKVGPDYWFPRDLYNDWIRSLPPTFQVNHAS